jgi:hypothetical protein
MGGLVENNEPLFFTTFICKPRAGRRLMKLKSMEEGRGIPHPSSPSAVIIIIDNQQCPKAHSQ